MLRLYTEVPPIDEPDIVRIDFDGGFLFRRLPKVWGRSVSYGDDRDGGNGVGDGGCGGGGEGVWGQDQSGWFGGGRWFGEGPGKESVETDHEAYETASEGEEGDDTSVGSGGVDKEVHKVHNFAGVGREVGEEGASSRINPHKCANAEMILVSVQMFVDPKLPYLPPALINFVLRTVLYLMWVMLLRAGPYSVPPFLDKFNFSSTISDACNYSE